MFSGASHRVVLSLRSKQWNNDIEIRTQKSRNSFIWNTRNSQIMFFQTIETFLKIELKISIPVLHPSPFSIIQCNFPPLLISNFNYFVLFAKEGETSIMRSRRPPPLCHHSVRFFRANEKARPQKTERERETSRAKLRVQSPFPADLASTIPPTKKRWPILISLKRRSTYWNGPRKGL